MCEVSVEVISYNQGKYLGQCLESIVRQNTKFDFEVFIHDDGSTDNSREIILQYAHKYPDKVRYYFQDIPMLLAEPRQVLYDIILRNLNGRYIAFCEGDDYWDDDFKLQKQYDALEQNEDCDICVHGVKLINAIDESYMGSTPGKLIINKSGIVKKNWYIKYRWLRDGSFWGANSFFYRKEAILKCESLEFMNKAKFNDFSIFYGVARNSNIYCLLEDMAVKRVGNKGSLSYLNKQYSCDERLKDIERDIDILLSIRRCETGNVGRDIDNIILYKEIMINNVSLLCGDSNKKVDYWTGRLTTNSSWNRWRGRVMNLLEKSYFFHKIQTSITFSCLTQRVE